jgi:hypothetical protein
MHQKRRSITEQNLLECVTCSLRLTPPVEYPVSIEEDRVLRTVKWATLWSVHGSVPTESVLLDRLRQSEEGGVPFFKKDVAETIAQRIINLTTKWKLVTPITAYHAHFGSITIHGSYGLFKEAESSTDELYILRTVGPHGTPASWAPPDIVEQARYLHFRTHSGSERDPKLLKYSITEDWDSIYQPTNKTANDWLSSVVSTYMNGSGFPVAGPHCSTCLTTACLEVVDG